MLTILLGPLQKKDQRTETLSNGVSLLKDGGNAGGCRASTGCHVSYLLIPPVPSTVYELETNTSGKMIICRSMAFCVFTKSLHSDWRNCKEQMLTDTAAHTPPRE